MENLVIHHDAPGFLIATWSSVIMAAWARAASRDDIARLREHQLKLIKDCPGGVSSLTILRNFSLRAAPDEGLREAGARLAREVEPHLLGAATVIEMEGMAGTVVRTFVTGVSLLARSNTPVKIFRSLDDGLQWLASRPNQLEKVMKGIPALRTALLKSLAERPSMG